MGVDIGLNMNMVMRCDNDREVLEGSIWGRLGDRVDSKLEVGGWVGKGWVWWL